MLVEALPADQRVVPGDRVGAVAVDVEAEDAPEEVLGHVLAVAPAHPVVPVVDVAGADVAGGPTVADADVQPAVGAERQVPRVVVALGLGHLEDRPLGVTPDAAAVGGRPELREHEGVAVPVGGTRPPRGAVAQVEPAVVGEPRMEGDAEQSPLATGRDGVPEVERRLGGEAVGLVADDEPLLLEDVPAVGVRRDGHRDRCPEPLDDGLEAHRRGRGRPRRRHRLGRGGPWGGRLPVGRAPATAREPADDAGAEGREDAPAGGPGHAPSASRGGKRPSVSAGYSIVLRLDRLHPDTMATACTFCGADVDAHEPVFVEERRGTELVPAGQFCNYACLARYIEAEGLETGACCRIDLG